MVRTRLREKGHNCDGRKRKTLNGDDKYAQLHNLNWGRYVMACKTLGIKPDIRRQPIHVKTRRQKTIHKNNMLAKMMRG